MLIPLHIEGRPSSDSASGPVLFVDSEPFLIELQGSIELSSEDGSITIDAAEAQSRGSSGGEGVLNGELIGKLDVSQPNKPVLQISHHRLEGKLVKLERPLAVIRHEPATTNHDEAGADGPETGRSKRLRLAEDEGLEVDPSVDVDEETRVEPLGRHSIVSLIRRKMVFSKRPEPIVNLPVPSSESAEPEEAKTARRR